MKFDIDFFIVEMKRRGVEVRAPANILNNSRLRDFIPHFDTYLLYNMYQKFDGFEKWSFDPLSEIRIWTVNEIISSILDSGNRNSDTFTFADVSHKAVLLNHSKEFGSDAIFMNDEEFKSYTNPYTMMTSMLEGEFL